MNQYIFTSPDGSTASSRAQKRPGIASRIYVRYIAKEARGSSNDCF